MQSHFKISFIEIECTEADVIKIILDPEIFELQHFTNLVDAWNFFCEKSLCDLIILNLNVPENSQFSLSCSKFLDDLFLFPFWKDVPKLIIVDQSIPKKEFIASKVSQKSDVIILSPFNPLRFINEVRRLITANIDRHIKKINEQHVEIANRLSKLSKKGPQQVSIGYYREKLLMIKLLIFEHFEHEELFLLSHNYLDASEHLENHNITRDKTRAIIEGLNLQNIEENIADLQNRLYADLADDKAYISFVKALKDMLL